MEGSEFNSQNYEKDKESKNKDSTAVAIPVLRTKSEMEMYWARQDMRDKASIAKNVIAISSSFTFLFSSFNSVSNLQSSINGVFGTTSLWVAYASLLASSSFLPNFLIHKLRIKWTLAISILTYSTFMAAQYYPTYYTLLPGAVVLGLGIGPMWSAKCTYLTQVGELYSEITKEKSHIVVTRFYGVFFLFFQMSHIIGNFISSAVISHSMDSSKPSNAFIQDVCGLNFCPLKIEGGLGINNDVIRAVKGDVISPFNASHMQVDEHTSRVIFSIYLACSLLSAALVALLVDPLTRFGIEDTSDEAIVKCGFSLLLDTFQHLKNPKQLFLIPLTVWSGLQQAFITADFTAAYVNCGVGIQWIGYVMICYGVCDALSSLVLPPLVQLLGRLPIFLAGAIVSASVIVFCLTWQPRDGDFLVYFLLAGMWGVGDSVWQTQVNALYGHLFIDSPEAAFSNYRIWESTGFIFGYCLSSYICVQWKIYVLLTVLSAGIIGYLIIEAMECLLWKSKK